ncbi:hypothetical protein KIL84_018336 [Mauremys mutica]|uniref:Uncharacterized protein n=1 Tax=Mauremys mutica TaxID=74926 RepID=A0A9D3XT46_9SAUR|nr:hypothetical protein KIL84_018336 [Mauremys mutica]
MSLDTVCDGWRNSEIRGQLKTQYHLINKGVLTTYPYQGRPDHPCDSLSGLKCGFRLALGSLTVMLSSVFWVSGLCCNHTVQCPRNPIRAQSVSLGRNVEGRSVLPS